MSNKKNLSIFLKTAAALSFGLGIGYFQLHNLNATDSQPVNNTSVVTPTAEIVKDTEAMTDLNINLKLSEDLLKLVEEKKILTQNELDNYLYYVVDAELSNFEFFSANDKLLSLVENATLLEELYKLANVEPGFTWVEENGAKVSITLTRDIKKPVTYEKIIKKVEKEVSKELESNQAEENQKSEATSKEAPLVEVPELVELKD